MQNDDERDRKRTMSDQLRRLTSRMPSRSLYQVLRTSAWLRIAAVLLVVLSPIVVYLLYELTRTASLRQKIIVATSQQGGRHYAVTNSLAEALQRDGLEAQTIPTYGSYANVLLLQAGLADIALYQAGTTRLLSHPVFEAWDGAGNGNGHLTKDEIPRDQDNNEDAVAEKTRIAAIFDALDISPKDGLLEEHEFRNTSMIRCVATLYSEVVHFIARKDAGINEPNDLRGKTVALGQPFSGNYAMSRLLLEQFGLNELPRKKEATADEKIDSIERNGVYRFDTESAADGFPTKSAAYYSSLEKGFREGVLDAAFITIGLHGQKVDDLLNNNDLDLELLGMPIAEGVTTKNVLVTPYRIPPGTYPNQRGDQEGLRTIAVKAQLLTRKDISDTVVQKVVETVMQQQFLLVNNLRDLATQSGLARVRAAQATLEFKLHRAANSFYNPDSFEPEEFQNWEALYSLIASFVIGVVVVSRWVAQRNERLELRRREEAAQEQKDRLDVFLNRTIVIEQAQIGVTDSEVLIRYLDDVTRIKLEALSKLTHEDLRSDRTFSIFLLQCANLINTIQLKVIAQTERPADHRKPQ